MIPGADEIADCVLESFDKLPQKRKPRSRGDGAREWVPLAGIVLARDGKLTCVSLGTGMKCLPSAKLPLAHGAVLHDWHAEVVAIRTFNRFLLDQLHLLLADPSPSSDFLRRRLPDEMSSSQCETENQPFTIKEDVKIFMYCSEAPCGDASMELVMDAQEDATPWTTPAPVISSSADLPPPDEDVTEQVISGLRGRSHFSHLGALRYKPSRPDAPPTLSKSCTDKLTLTQSTSLLSAVTSMLISPRNAYIHTLVLPESQLVPSACQRAFSRQGRMKHVTDEKERSWKAGYVWTPFDVRGTVREFAWSRRAVGSGSGSGSATEKAIASNISAVYTPSWQETLIGGVLQGRKQFDPAGASKVCRRSLWRVAAQVAGLVGTPMLVEALGKDAYGLVKRGEVLAARRRVKEDVRRGCLKSWVANAGDDDFGLESR